jgi:hypothetical protein
VVVVVAGGGVGVVVVVVVVVVAGGGVAAGAQDEAITANAMTRIATTNNTLLLNICLGSSLNNNLLKLNEIKRLLI